MTKPINCIRSQKFLYNKKKSVVPQEKLAMSMKYVNLQNAVFLSKQPLLLLQNCYNYEVMYFIAITWFYIITLHHRNSMVWDFPLLYIQNILWVLTGKPVGSDDVFVGSWCESFFFEDPKLCSLQQNNKSKPFFFFIHVFHCLYSRVCSRSTLLSRKK